MYNELGTAPLFNPLAVLKEDGTFSSENRGEADGSKKRGRCFNDVIAEFVVAVESFNAAVERENETRKQYSSAMSIRNSQDRASDAYKYAFMDNQEQSQPLSRTTSLSDYSSEDVKNLPENMSTGSRRSSTSSNVGARVQLPGPATMALEIPPEEIETTSPQKRLSIFSTGTSDSNGSLHLVDAAIVHEKQQALARLRELAPEIAEEFVLSEGGLFDLHEWLGFRGEASEGRRLAATLCIAQCPRHATPGVRAALLDLERRNDFGSETEEMMQASSAQTSSKTKYCPAITKELKEAVREALYRIDLLDCAAEEALAASALNSAPNDDIMADAFHRKALQNTGLQHHHHGGRGSHHNHHQVVVLASTSRHHHHHHHHRPGGANRRSVSGAPGRRSHRRTRSLDIEHMDTSVLCKAAQENVINVAQSSVGLFNAHASDLCSTTDSPDLNRRNVAVHPLSANNQVPADLIAMIDAVGEHDPKALASGATGDAVASDDSSNSAPASDAEEEGKVQKKKRSVASHLQASVRSLVPFLERLGLFKLFTPSEWLREDGRGEGRRLVAINYLLMYPNALTPALMNKLTQIRETCSPFLGHLIGALFKKTGVRTSPTAPQRGGCGDHVDDNTNTALLPNTHGAGVVDSNQLHRH
eukprot:Clim_evm141s210 gene=Clim_evmTU141s210